MNSNTSNDYTKINNLPEYSLGEVAHRVHVLRSEGNDIIDLSQLNPNLQPPQIAIDKLVQSSLMPHNHRYTASSGISILKEAISSYYKFKFKISLESSDNIVITSGTKEGIIHLLMSVLSPGDSMLVPVPSYPVHRAAAALLGITFIGVPLWKNFDDINENNGILTSESEYFFNRLENRYNQTWPRPKLILVSFPHNPTTTIVTKCFYQRLVSFANKNNCFIVNDFAHGDLFLNQSQCVSYLSVDGADKVGIELYSISKGFNLGGWRIGAAIGKLNAISALRSLKSYADFGIFQPIQIAAANLFQNEISSNGSHINDVVEIYKSRKKLVFNSLLSKGWSVIDSQATPFLWGRIPKSTAINSAKDYSLELLENKKVAIFPGAGFDKEQVDTVRISLTENETKLRYAMSQLFLFVLTYLPFLLFIHVSVKAEDSLSKINCPKALTLIKQAHVAAFSKEEIKKGLEEAIQICPNMVEGIYEFGRFYLQEGNYELAEAKFRQADSLKPRGEHSLGIALCQVNKKDYASAENTYKQALTNYLGHWSLLEGLGVLYYELNKLTEAEELLRQALQSESTVDSLYYNLGLVLEKQGRVEEAIISYRTSLEKNNKSLLAAIALMRLLQRLDKDTEAISIGDKALLHSPNNESLIFVLSDSYINLERFADAKREILKIQSASNKIKKEVLMELLNFKQSNMQAGFDKLEDLYKKNGSNTDVLRAYGMVLAIKREYVKAEEVLLKALNILPTDPVILNNLGTVYEGLGKIDKAKDYYTRAQSFGAYKLVEENLERLR